MRSFHLEQKGGLCRLPLAHKLWPGNAQSVEDWEERSLPEIERQQGMGRDVAFGDARRGLTASQ